MKVDEGHMRKKRRSRRNPEKVRSERESLLAYAADLPHDALVLASCVRSLSEAVVSKHFSHFGHREELVMVGIEKALRMLRSDYFDPTQNVMNFVYSGIRNEVGNFLRRETRTHTLDLEDDRWSNLSVMGSTEEDAALGVEFERHHSRIRDRLRLLGETGERYRDVARGAALYRAIL